MAKTQIKQNFELTTRGISKVAAEISLTVDGREIPSMSVLGDSLEKALVTIQTAITESYKLVPERV